ncbi:hypothetical protein APHAL10511_005550 [Amanita phalloides]|nr:hypothetical protein APHAL10511_005550 [Amanita phalloides]
MPYYGPLEDSYILFQEKGFLAADFVSGVGYGIQLALYIKCVVHLWNRRKSRGNGSLFLLGYITVLLSLYLLFLASGARTTEDMYINNRNYPGGPWAYFLATQNLPENVLFIVSLFLLTFLSDLLVLWRCWVIWNSSGNVAAYAATAIPATALLTSFALGIMWIWVSSQKGFSVFDSFPLAIGTAYCVTSFIANSLLTILIIFRLVLHRRRILAILPSEHAAHYVSLAIIITESAALYSIFALAYIVTYAIDSPINLILLPMLTSSQQISSYLIILRLVRERAWSLDALTSAAGSESRLTTLQFKASSLSPDDLAIDKDEVI